MENLKFYYSMSITKSPRAGTGGGVVRPRPEDDEDMEDPECLFQRLMADAKTTILNQVRGDLSEHNRNIDSKLDSAMAKLDKSVASSNEDILSKTKQYIDAVDSRSTKKLDRHTTALEELSAKQAEQSETNARMLAKMAQIEEGLAQIFANGGNPSAASAQSSGGPPNPSHTLPSGDPNAYDKTVLRINSRNPVKKDKLLPIIRDLCDEAGLQPTQWELKGPPVAKRYTLAFHVGDADKDTAALRANKVNQSLQNEDKTWRELSIQIPANNTERLFIGFDRSRKSKLLEQATNHIFLAIKKKHGDTLEIDKIKYDHGIIVGWQFAAICYYDDNSNNVTLEWFDEILDANAIDKREFQEAHDCKFRRHTPKA